MSTCEIKSLPLLEYYGQHKTNLPFLMGFEKRTIANDYSGRFEIFYDEVIILERLHNALPRDIKSHQYILAAREKLTQLLIVANVLGSQLEEAESQILTINDPKYNLYSSYFSLLNEVEFFLFKLVSFLDIISKLAAYFYRLKENKNIKDSYGKQKALDRKRNTFSNPFDSTYQNRLLKNTVINLLHSYRNEFTHNASLKLIPWKRNNQITLVVTKGNKQGVKMRMAIQKSIGELKRFIGFYERFFMDYLKNAP